MDDELRALAAARMVAQVPGHTLDAAALVHEAHLRLVEDQSFDGRGHFSAAAEAIRRILVDAIRRKGVSVVAGPAAGRTHRYPGRHPTRQPAW